MGSANRRRNKSGTGDARMVGGAFRADSRGNQARDQGAQEDGKVAAIHSRVSGLLPRQLGAIRAGLSSISTGIAEAKSQQNHCGAKLSKNQGGNNEEIGNFQPSALQKAAALSVDVQRLWVINGTGAMALKFDLKFLRGLYGHIDTGCKARKNWGVFSRVCKRSGLFPALGFFQIQAGGLVRGHWQ